MTAWVTDRAFARGSMLPGPRTTVPSIVVTAALVVVGALPQGQVKCCCALFLFCSFAIKQFIY